VNNLTAVAYPKASVRLAKRKCVRRTLQIQKSLCFFLVKLTLETFPPPPFRQTLNYLIIYGTVTLKIKCKSSCYVILSVSRYHHKPGMYQSNYFKIRRTAVQSQRYNCSMLKDRER